MQKQDLLDILANKNCKTKYYGCLFYIGQCASLYDWGDR